MYNEIMWQVPIAATPEPAKGSTAVDLSTFKLYYSKFTLSITLHDVSEIKINLS